MRGEKPVVEIIQAMPRLMDCLTAVGALRLPDCWIGAGAIRNTVWDRLHGFSDDTAHDTDVDVVWFDPEKASPDQDSALEARLSAAMPGQEWQVRNQARMHMRNRDPAYRDTEDALRYWPETATAVAARLRNGQVELIAPFGLDDLLGLTVRPTPAFRQKPEIYAARQASKNWSVRWPKLKFLSE
jgi:hypothetical protein